ncbi:MAG: MFS transporter [Alphaproteobacteria bacterium]|nr:MFS transporter [Alphaproteobacteria bacterium]
MFFATGLSYAGFYFCRKPFYIAKSTLEEVYHWDAATLGWIGTGYLVAYACGQFLAGWSGNRWGPRVLLLTGMGVSIACNVAFGLSNSWQTFAAFMVVNGLAQATGWSNNVGTMGRWFRRNELGTIMGFWGIHYQAGGVLSNALAAFLLDLYGVQWSFFGGSLVLFAIWTFFVFNQRNRPEDVGLAPIVSAEEADAHANADGSDRWPTQVFLNVLLVGVFYFFIKFIRYSLWSWAPYMLDRDFGMDADDAGYLSTVFDVAGIFGVIVCGWMSDRVGKRARTALIWILFMALSCGLLFVLGSSSLVFFGISLGLIGFTLMGPDALMTGAGAIEVGSAKKAVLAVGIINGMGSIGSVAQELVMGSLLKSGGPNAVFGTLLASGILSGLALGVLVYRESHGIGVAGHE